MFKIGCHLSSSRGYLAMGREAISIGANTFQFFSRNPRGSQVKPLDLEDIAAYRDYAAENGIGTVLAHAPYTLNPSSKDPGLREFAIRTMIEDIERLEHIPGTLYNFHPGSHVKQGVETGIAFIAEALNQVLKKDQKTIVLLETMAGKGTEIGRTFEELRAIIDRTELGAQVGVCIDSCHLSDAGYDVINDLDGVLEAFDRTLGLERLKAVHLNDSKNQPGSQKDRHETIGNGTLGLEAIVRIINHPLLRDKPFLLETPNDLAGYAAEIALLKAQRQPQ